MVDALPFLLPINLLIVMLLWSYLSTTCTPIATVPLEYHLTDEEAENYLRNDEQHRAVFLQNLQTRKNLVVHMRTPCGGIRYCMICKAIKPDRAHHCSICRVCVLKMDHHCGWVNNCVGFSNHKNFILMLVYCVVYCGFFMGTTVTYFMLYVNTGDHQYVGIAFGFILASLFGVIGIIFILINCVNMFKNQTYVESVQKVILTEQSATYNLGCCRNFMQMFGKNWKLWMFPVFSSVGNGLVFPVIIRQS